VALETLKKISHINGHEIKRVKWNQPLDNHIEVNDEGNAITFKIQKGPIKENGVNGCQVDELVSAALLIVKGLNKKFPCEENVRALGCLYSAQTWLQQRTLNRKARGVEGTSKQ